MKSLKKTLSKAGLEAPAFFTDDFTNPAAFNSDGIENLTNPFHTKPNENDKNKTKLVGKGMSQTKTYKQKKNPKKPRPLGTKKVKKVNKVKKVKIEVIEAHCAHDGNCEVCYKCIKCNEKSKQDTNGKEMNIGSGDNKIPTPMKTRKECKPCGTLHKLYCNL